LKKQKKEECRNNRKNCNNNFVFFPIYGFFVAKKKRGRGGGAVSIKFKNKQSGQEGVGKHRHRPWRGRVRGRHVLMMKGGE
jgi:hypothetical protein